VRRGLRARRPRLNSCSVPFQETPKEAWVDHMGRLFWAGSSFGRFVQTQRTSRVDGRSSLIFSGTCTRRSFAPSGSNGTEEFCTEDPLANQIACKKHHRPLSDTGCWPAFQWPRSHGGGNCVLAVDGRPSGEDGLSPTEEDGAVVLAPVTFVAGARFVHCDNWNRSSRPTEPADHMHTSITSIVLR
jgi:hypothetical protein